MCRITALHFWLTLIPWFSSSPGSCRTASGGACPCPGLVASRTSFESSTSTEEFFDAAEGSLDRSRLLRIDHQSEEDTPASDVDEATMHDSSSLSSAEDDEQYAGTGPDGTSNLFPAKPKSLSPLAHH